MTRLPRLSPIRYASAIAVALCAYTPRASAQAAALAPTIAIVPQPESLTLGTGEFKLSPTTVIWTDAASADVARRFAASLAPATGLTIPVRVGTAATGIVLTRDARLTRLGAEGYELTVAPRRVLVRAKEAAGIFYALQTIRQLLPPEVLRQAKVDSVPWTMPAVRIVDRPRFAWRGAHLDVARHFMPKEFVKKYVDLLAMQKMNSFHWHLTDDQGWRIEIRKYPRLTEVGAWRTQTLVGHQPSGDSTTWPYDGQRHGGFYTQDDVREIVAYARDRFVNVVPEIEMPGHALAAIAAYPQLGVTAQPADVGMRWGVYANILNAEESTVSFMQDVLTEVLALFPSQFIHIGGDEADKALWKTSPRIQERIRELALKDEHELQSWFIRRIDAFLTSRGRRLVGWDEILEGGIAPGATVMSWRGTKGGVDAARAGHDVIITPTSHTYLDYYQSRNTAGEPLAIGGFLPLETVYAFDPVPAELEPEQRAHVLGAQGQLWTEYLPGPKQVEYMAFPRLTALAEVLWTPPARRNYDGFLARLDDYLRRLAIMDVAYRPPGP
ncbi:MAG TPA: beta-N-acetylhexosaminidase [Gemmatimonadaceae bacterium]|nr:beta-N-acetylhexosaminidase [Gemmatimonadaceae bacterium]